MDFIRKNISKQKYRNGTLFVNNSTSSTSISKVGNITDFSGYLPATTDDKITYTVPHYVNFSETITDTEGNETTKNILEITTDGIKINGNVIASGEVSAYGSGSTSGGSGTNVTIYDALDSTATDIALSANQGRVLDEKITEITKSLESGVTTPSSLTLTNLTDINVSGVTDKQILVYNAKQGKWINSDNNVTSELAKLTDVSISGVTDKQILIYDGENSKWVNQTFNIESSAVTQHLEDTTKHITADERTNWNNAFTSAHSHSNIDVLNNITSDSVNNWNSAYSHIEDSVKHITADERTNWNNKLDKSTWDSAFYFDSDNNLRVKLNLIGEGEISAYGSGSTENSTSVITIVDNLTSTSSDAALSANQGRVLKELIDNIEVGDLDLSDYSKTGHTHAISAITNLQTALNAKSSTSHTHSNYSLTSHTHNDYAASSHTHAIADISNLQTTLDGKSDSSHTHNYVSNVKVGNTNYTVSANTITLPSYPTLTSLSAVSTSNFNSHSGNTTLHITSTERTNWNKAYTNNHTHSNKTVLDGITSTKVSNWDGVVTNWNNAFYFDSDNNLRVKLNLIGEKEVSAYGSGSTENSTGVITIVDNLTSTSSDAALSANQGRVLKELIDNIEVGDLDLSDYSKTGHTHAIADITNLQTALNNKSSTSHTHSNYSLTSHTHAISAITNLQTTLDSKSSTSHTHSNYSLTSHSHSNYSTTSHTHTFASLTSKPTTLAGYGITNFVINNVQSASIDDYKTVAGIYRFGSVSASSLPDTSGYGNAITLYATGGDTFAQIYASYGTANNDGIWWRSSTTGGTPTWKRVLDSTNYSAYTPTLTNFKSHSGNTTLHITSTERTNWNAAYSNNHTHSNKTVLDGITSTKVSNWDTVYSNWNKVFTINSNGDLRVKVNLIGEGEISAYGSGSTSGGSGVITIVDNLTSTSSDAALSANQGRVLKNLIDSIEVGDLDLSDYSKTGHTHAISDITNLQTALNAKSSTSHTHTQYAASSHTHAISAITNLQTTLDGKSGTGHTHINYYDYSISRTKNTVLAAPNGSAGSATFRALVAADIPALAISKITNLQSSLDAKSSTSHTHSNYSLTSHSHSNYSTTSHTHSYLPLSGGTMTGNLIINHDKSGGPYMIYYNSRITSGGGGWADTIISLQDIDGTSVGRMGMYGTGETLNHIYIGHDNDYNGQNFRIYSDRVTFGSYTILHSNNYSGYTPTLTNFNSHSGNTTLHITSTERTNWNKAYTNNHTHSNKTVLDGITSTLVTNWNTAYSNNHTHSNKTVLDGITSTKVSNWDTVYSNWNKVFTINSNGDLQVKVNVIGEKEVSAYGSGSTSSSDGGVITIVDNLTSTSSDAALSANQGRVLKNLIDSIDVGDLDLSAYSKTGHTHAIADITNLQTALNAKSSTSHTHSYLPLSGGTMTGVLYLTNNSSYIATSNSAILGFGTSSVFTGVDSATSGTVVGGIDYQTILRTNADNLYHYRRDKTAKYLLLDTANYTSYCATASHSHSNYSLTSHTHTTVVGNYTQNGGQQNPNYFGKNRIGWLMMNTTVNGNNNYKDWMISDCYSGNDVGGGVAFGINRQALGAYIMRSASGRTSWAESAELIGTHNYTTYCATASHSHSNYSLTSHTHTFASLTSKPTTLAGYGITNFAVSAPQTSSIDNYKTVSGIYRFGSVATSSLPDSSGYGNAITLYGGGDTFAQIYASYGTATNDGIWWRSSTTGGTPTWKRVLDSTNYSAYTVTKTGSGASGTWGISITGNAATASDSTKFGGYNLRGNYSFENDKIDAMIMYTVNATSLSTSNFYPIIFPASTKDLKVNMYSTEGSSTLAYNQNTLDFIWRGKGWNDTPISLTILNYHCYQSTEMTIGSLGMGTEGGDRCVWVRGGLTYYITSNQKPNLKTANYTSGNQIFTVGTTISGGTNTKVTIYWNPQSTSNCNVMYHRGAIKAMNGFIGSLDGNATSASKVNSTLTFSAGTFSAGSFNGSAAKTINVPTHTSHITNNSGYITSGATVAAANKVTSTLSFSAGTFSAGSFNGSAAKTINVPTHTSHITNNSGYITTGATVAAANKLATVRTIWGQSFNGTANVTGNITGSYFLINDTSNNPYLKLIQGSNWFIQGYNGYLYLGAGSTKSLRIDATGNCYSVGEVTAYSDRRLKSSIQPLQNRGELKPVTYIKDGKQSIGFIAQDVEELYPELVITDESTEEKYKTLNYAQLTAVLAGQINELKAEIEELKKLIKK